MLRFFALYFMCLAHVFVGMLIGSKVLAPPLSYLVMVGLGGAVAIVSALLEKRFANEKNQNS